MPRPRATPNQLALLRAIQAPGVRRVAMLVTTQTGRHSFVLEKKQYWFTLGLEQDPENRGAEWKERTVRSVVAHKWAEYTFVDASRHQAGEDVWYLRLKPLGLQLLEEPSPGGPA